MSILTKISVVVLTVLILAASVVFINMATVSANYRDAWERQQTRNDVLQQENRQYALERDQLQQQWERSQRDLADSENEKRALQQTTQATVDRLTADKVGMETALQKATATSDGLQTTLGKERERFVAMQERQKSTWDALNDANSRIRDLVNTLADRELQIDRGLRTIDQYRKRISDLEVQNKDYAQQLEDLRAGKAPTTAAADGGTTPAEESPIIYGTIAVLRPNGLAGINVGSRQGIREGMKMIIYRDGHFVGHLEIGHVEEDSAGGVIEDQTMAPAIGDQVKSR